MQRQCARAARALAFAAALLCVGATPAPAADARLCLSAEQQRAAIAARQAVPLGRAVRSVKARVGGDVIRARLCNSNTGLVYVLTVLSGNGKVMRARVDAASGAFLGR